MDINKRIRHYIKDNGMSYSFVSKQANIEYKRFSRQMTLKSKIDIDEYGRICSALGVNLEFFFEKQFLDSKNTA